MVCLSVKAAGLLLFYGTIVGAKTPSSGGTTTTATTMTTYFLSEEVSIETGGLGDAEAAQTHSQTSPSDVAAASRNGNRNGDGNGNRNGNGDANPTSDETLSVASSAVTISVSTSADHSTVATVEPVRHGFGRGFPPPHYHLPDSRWGPFFEDGSDPQNITARVGSTIMIDCGIGLLQNKTVTWLHHKGDSIHLLTVGRSAYSSDERITLSFRYPNNFRLQISYVTRRDEGLYECQVATHPPKVKRTYLKVTAPEVRIVDESGREVTERYYKAGSALELTCLASQVGVGPTTSPADHPITWRHGDRMLSKGISSNLSMATDSAVSALTVAPLEKRHSGNYTCAVGALAFATVAVHVLNGELPAAVHHNTASSKLVSTGLVLLTFTCLLILQR